MVISLTSLTRIFDLLSDDVKYPFLHYQTKPDKYCSFRKTLLMEIIGMTVLLENDGKTTADFKLVGILLRSS